LLSGEDGSTQRSSVRVTPTCAQSSGASEASAGGGQARRAPSAQPRAQRLQHRLDGGDGQILGGGEFLDHGTKVTDVGRQLNREAMERPRRSGRIVRLSAARPPTSRPFTESKRADST
jgi:hypothetical protein